jgi:hypothetical protein
MPAENSILAELCQHLGYRITNNPSAPFDVAFKYFDATFFTLDLLEVLESILDDVINVRSLDISKYTIGVVFRNIFGYPLNLDPCQHNGQILKKSNINALCDGEIITTPITKNECDQDAAYQKLIDNTIPETDEVMDYSVPIHNGMIPLVYQKYRPLGTRFHSANTRVEMKETTDIFTPEEITNLIQFAQKIGLEYGDLDVLRDRQNGKIYIVDANNTPWDSTAIFNEEEKQNLFERLSQTFAPLIASKL